MNEFTTKDLKQIEELGLSMEKVRQNIQTFEQGISHTELIAAATLENGILKLTEKEIDFYSLKYDGEKKEVIKFVPASGAATRMFKDLQAFLQTLPNEEELENQLNLPEFSNVRIFFDGLPQLPFYQKMLRKAEKYYPGYDEFSPNEKAFYFLGTLFDEDKANLSNLPKGLVPFHEYETEIRTAFEEHFFEAAFYAAKNGHAKLHFTISDAHLQKFEEEFQKVRNRIEKQTGVKFTWEHSFQQKNTDTLAVNMENRPFRDETGNLCFRPAGHGALLENLNQTNADIVFIKNIDNVSTQRNIPLIGKYKKALAGILLEIQSEVVCFLNQIETFSDKPENENAETFHRAKLFLKEKLNVRHEPKSVQEIMEILNRPIRVCGMVENSGAPGGGPFWIKDGKGDTSLQIVETAQIDRDNPQQNEILAQATHFNPVDLVCGMKNHRGEKYDLSKFSNLDRGFITQKSVNGKDLKALELPGLWNGSMEYWNTIFVEVPKKTFNPVKTVLDLLKPEHQIGK